MFCTHCGNKLNPNHRFCTMCGQINPSYQRKENRKVSFLIAAIIFLVIAIVLLAVPFLIETISTAFWVIFIIVTLGLILLANPDPFITNMSIIYIVCYSISCICFIISIVCFIKYFKSKENTSNNQINNEEK